MGGAAASAAGASLASPALAGSQQQPVAVEIRDELDGSAIGFLRNETLVDEDRLRFFMRGAGLDAIAVTNAANVYYLSNHFPQLDRMGFEDTTVAIITLDTAAPLALVMHGFLYYYTHSPETEFVDRLVFPFTEPETGADLATEAEPKAVAARTMRAVDGGVLTPRDRHRARMFEKVRPASASADWALAKAIRELGLSRARIGIDDPVLAEALGRRGFEGTTAPAENVIRTARLAKSATELKLMRMAASNNVAAALEAGTKARELGSSAALRHAFASAAARRGNVAKFMIVAGSSAETIDEPLTDGSAVSIDCVSSLAHYHGDFGRTIFIGEPPLAVRRAGEAIMIAWQEIQAQLRPGMAFRDIPRIGRATLRKLEQDLPVSFNPHSVGLYHTDHPQPSLLEPQTPDDLTLERDMILSVDCPLFLAGLGGTFHFENLMHITDGGAEPLHDNPPPIILA